MAATHQRQNTGNQTVLYMAMELSQTTWRLAFSTDHGRRPRQRTVAARDLPGLEQEIERAKERFGLPMETPVRSCYEAGLDGFWLHRVLKASGVANVVVDASSIEVNRRARRAKSDSLDATKLVAMLMRYHGGERHVWSTVRVPGREDEADRQLHRELLNLRTERTRHTNRIKGLLVSQGVKAEVKRDFESRLSTLRTGDDQPLATALIERIERECVRLRLVERQILDVKRKREALIRQGEDEKHAQIRSLLSVRGIGLNSAYLWVMEVFGWREIRNGKQLGAMAGLAPTPYASGESDREQGISKAGNKRVRAMAIEIAWCWLRYQPKSELSRWFERRFGSGGKRSRKVGIVALARKLLVQLWRYLAHGEVPPGAVTVDYRSKLRASLT